MANQVSAGGDSFLLPSKGGGYSGGNGYGSSGSGGGGTIAAPKFTPPSGGLSLPGSNNIVPFKTPPAPNFPTFSRRVSGKAGSPRTSVGGGKPTRAALAAVSLSAMLQLKLFHCLSALSNESFHST